VHHLGIRIAWRLALILPLALLLVVDIGSGVHTVQQLDVAHLQTLMHGLSDDAVEDALQLVPVAARHQAVLELGQR